MYAAVIAIHFAAGDLLYQTFDGRGCVEEAEKLRARMAGQMPGYKFALIADEEARQDHAQRFLDRIGVGARSAAASGRTEQEGADRSPMGTRASNGTPSDSAVRQGAV